MTLHEMLNSGLGYARMVGTTAPRKRHRSPAPIGNIGLTVGRRIRELRQAKGLSQSQLGAPYFTRAHVSACELGKLTASVKTLAHFARKLDVPLRDLIPEDL